MSPNVAQGFVMVYPDYRVWGGEAVLKQHELGTVKLPAHLVKAGTKRIYPAKRLHPFFALRKRVENACTKYGFRAGSMHGVYLVRRKHVEELSQLLSYIQSELEARKQDFANHYDDGIAELRQEAGESWPILQQSLLTADEALGRMSFRWLISNVMSSDAAEDLGTSVAKSQGQAVIGLSQQIREEVNGQIERFMDELGALSRPKGASFNNLRHLAMRLSGIDAFDPLLGKVEKELTQSLAAVPQNGGISDKATMQVISALARIRHHLVPKPETAGDEDQPSSPEANASQSIVESEVQDQDEEEGVDLGEWLEATA